MCACLQEAPTAQQEPQTPTSSAFTLSENPTVPSAIPTQADTSDVEVTSFIRGSGLVQVKQEPQDPELQSMERLNLTEQMTRTEEHGSHSREGDGDDDVIYVDTETTFKYLTGNIEVASSVYIHIETFSSTNSSLYL